MVPVEWADWEMGAVGVVVDPARTVIWSGVRPMNNRSFKCFKAVEVIADFLRTIINESAGLQSL